MPFFWHDHLPEQEDTLRYLYEQTDALPCHAHFPVCLLVMNIHSRAAKKNTSHGNVVLPQDTIYLIQRPRYQRGSLCQDPAGNRTTRRPDHH